jgi:hypothetical protein
MAQDTSANLSSLTVSKTPPPPQSLPGHGDATVEVVITHEKTYDLVRKRPGEAAAIGEATDRASASSSASESGSRAVTP